jgi:sugar-phosphatase
VREFFVEFTARAVLFDNDGVLVDSRDAGELSWATWARGRGLDPATVLPGVHGRRTRETVALYVPAGQVDEAVAEIDRLEISSAVGTPAVPGAIRLITQIPERAKALVTSGSRALATARLTAAGVPVPQTVVAAENVTAGKPDPEPYLSAARLLGLAPSDCLIVEDSPTGLQAARAAGAAAIVGVGQTAIGQGCDAVVPDCTSLTWTGGSLLVTDELEHAR